MNSTDRKSIIALVVIVLVGAPFVWFLHGVKFGPGPEVVAVKTPVKASVAGANGTSIQSLSSHALPSAPQKLEVLAAPSEPSLVLDIYDPAKLRDAASKNAWLLDVMKQPLGQGFVGPWAGFWGTKGEDVAASFKGEVMDFVASQLLNAPLRIVWFGGSDATSTPVLLVPKPSATAKAAFTALTQAAGHGEQIADICPGDAKPEDVPDGGAPKGPHVFSIQRWVLANQAIYASESGGQISLARNPMAIVQGLCAKLAEPAHTAGADVELTFATEALGHEAQVLTSLLGVGAAPRLAFAIEGDRLVPRGIAGELAIPGRIDTAPLSDDLLRAIPVDAPVLLGAQLKLPEALDPETLKAFFAAKTPPPTMTRQVAVLWIPHGDAKSHSEVALFWSRVQDAQALAKAFAGANALEHATVCNQLVFASTRSLLERIQRSCDSKSPSLANAAGPVVAGLKAPASISLSMQLGALISGVTLDAWKEEAKSAGNGDAIPKEIDAARQQLEQLPTLGFTGTAQGSALVAGGFHS